MILEISLKYSAKYCVLEEKLAFSINEPPKLLLNVEKSVLKECKNKNGFSKLNSCAFVYTHPSIQTYVYACIQPDT